MSAPARGRVVALWLLVAWVALLPSGCDRSRPCVGVLLPLSGTFREWGQEAKRGMQMAWDEVDPDQSVRLHFMDTESREDLLPARIGELVEEHGATIILGPLTTGHALLASAVAASYEVPLVTPSATGAEITAGNGWAFRFCYSDPDVAEALAHFARYDLDLRRLALVVDLANSWSVGLAEGFRREFIRARGQIVAEVTHYDDPAELPGVIARLAELDIDGALIADYHDHVVALMAADTGGVLSDLVLLGSDGWEGPDIAGAMAGRVAGAYYTSHFCPEESDVPDERQTQVRSFLDRYAERYGDARPTDFVALGYDAVRAVLGIYDEQADGATLAARLRTLRYTGLTGRLSLDADGSAEGKTMVFEQLHATDATSRFVKRSRG